ncbi:APC family permease [Rubrobacter calidifluminis]|uniref:APC family permease n=1 Tax=Rubrobacter calidifluminis TaxID=1392640 RepID=UPI00235F2930|nr:APC family permease [Rubrobacter calidifluminis]
MSEDRVGVESFGYRQELKRSLGLWDLVIYGLIFMVPIAPFGIFGSVYAISKGMVALAYVIGMVGMVFTAMSYSEMSRAFPLSGSVYTYVGRGIAQPLGFLAGWGILLDYILVPTLLYVVSGAAMQSVIPGVPIWAWVLAFIVFNTIINYLGIEMTARTNRIMLVAELIVLAIFLVFGILAIASGRGGVHFSFDPLYDPGRFSLHLVFGAVSVAVLSFLGFDGISTLAEENREDARQIGRSILLALFLAGALFIVQTWVAALLVQNPQHLINTPSAQDSAFYDVAGFAGGRWLGVLTAVATAVAWGFANALVAQAATSRLLYSMARDGQLPRILSRVHPRRRVPENAMFLVAGVSVVVGLWASAQSNAITLLSTLVNFGALFAFLLLHTSVIYYFVVRRHSGRWGRHLLSPAIGLVIIGYVLSQAFPSAKTVGLIWLAIGVVVVIVLRMTGRRVELSGLSDGQEGKE